MYRYSYIAPHNLVPFSSAIFLYTEILKTRLLYGCVLCSSALQFPVTAAEGWLVCDFVSCGLCAAGNLFIFNLRAKTIGKGTRALDFFSYRCGPISRGDLLPRAA
jgi:hypothetical protein